MTKHDSVTGQSDASLADAEFSVYEYQKETGSYEPYHYEDRKLMTDREDETMKWVRCTTIHLMKDGL